jgi:hypothetical protein
MDELEETQAIIADEQRIMAYRAERDKLSRQERMYHRAWMRIAKATPVPSRQVAPVPPKAPPGGALVPKDTAGVDELFPDEDDGDIPS